VELRRQYADLPGVTFLGQVDRRALYELLSTARALVVPSRCYEGFPRAIVEAYAAGVPVVASDIGSLAEIVDDRGTGMLVRVGDPDDMSRALRELAGSGDLCDDLGRRARALYERAHSPVVTTDALLDVYREAIDERRARNS
jgi:glycosyltransferase involved in cell wall biosynthesis